MTGARVTLGTAGEDEGPCRVWGVVTGTGRLEIRLNLACVVGTLPSLAVSTGYHGAATGQKITERHLPV